MPAGTDGLLVVVGAGASFDCLPAVLAERPPGEPLPLRTVQIGELPRHELRHVRPPLTQGLADAQPFFNSLLSGWNAARPVIDYVRRNLREAAERPIEQAVTLEGALTSYQAMQETVPEVERHLLAARFYLRDVLWGCTTYMTSPELSGGITNYDALLRHVLRWCGAHDASATIVSYNYDLLLERAMESSWQFAPANLEDYVAHDRVKVVKPHGSVQWHWPVIRSANYNARDPFTFGRASIEAAMQHGVDDTLIESLPGGSLDWRLATSRRAVVPALALPVDGKDEYVWPASQERQMRSLEGRISRLLVIGWRGLEPHFLATYVAPAMRVGARAMVVTGGRDSLNEANAIVDRLAAEVGEQTEYHTFTSGFQGLLEPVGAQAMGWLLRS